MYPSLYLLRKLLFFLSCLLVFNAGATSVASLVHLNEQYAKANKLSVEEVHALLDLAYYYNKYEGNFHFSDSICRQAIQVAYKLKSTPLIVKTYEAYYMYSDEFEQRTNSQMYVDRFGALADSVDSEELRCYASYFQSLTWFRSFHFFKAKEKANQIVSKSAELGLSDLQAKALLLISDCHNRLEEKKMALTYLLQALDITRNANLSELNLKTLEALAAMFHLNKNYEKSLEYRDKINEVILSKENPDSLAWISNAFYRIESSSYLNFSKEIEDEAEALMQLSIQRGYMSIYNIFWAFYRSYLIDNHRLERLYILYHETYPEQLRILEKTDLELYYRLQTYFNEYKGKLDTAMTYWEKAEPFWANEPSYYKRSARYIRFAEFLIRTQNYDLAYEKGKAALKWAKAAKYLNFQMQAEALLEQIELQRGFLDSAYVHATNKYELELRIIEMSNEEGLLMMEMYHDMEHQEIVRKKEEETRTADMRATRIMSNAYAIGLVLFLMLSAVIFRQYRLTNQEKIRSDELLLNILPADTAKELKSKGVTTAMHYDNVTVLFCDIVGFTKFSEQMSPTALVREIDIYFRAFDEIIEQYGMEKIKTIGDAYLAVGGVPAQNNATAIDVVSAALAFINKVQELAEERIKDGRRYFELRIGIHTGSVVAGVVGSKKFQYDIWGESVNTAARMEQHSEPGRVNISKVTYELVKDSFECISRGKVEAKNMGAVDMYFVKKKLIS